jgi:hypothetical protein
MNFFKPIILNQGSLTYNANYAAGKAVESGFRRRENPGRTGLGRMLNELSEKARQDLFSFLDNIGLASDNRMLVIPSTRHFFYDAEELKEIRTVINLKQLNHIRDIKEFLRTVSEILPHTSNFVGCFVDNRKQKAYSDKAVYHADKAEAYENGIESRIPFINRMYSMMDLRTNRYLSKRSVISLLSEYGFQLVGMTEMNGMTYFHTRKNNPAA